MTRCVIFYSTLDLGIVDLGASLDLVAISSITAQCGISFLFYQYGKLRRTAVCTVRLSISISLYLVANLQLIKMTPKSRVECIS